MKLASNSPELSLRWRLSTIALFAFLLLCASAAMASPAYVRVNQAGYESENSPFRAYLMSAVPESGATFKVINSDGHIVYQDAIGALLGTWSNSTKLVYEVYALNFSAPGGDVYTISVEGPEAATSPQFAVDAPAVLYPGLLLNTLWFYETERDGPDYIPNALRTAPGHLNDKNTTVYDTPPLNSNDLITTTGTPLTSTGEVINGDGGWWDAGDYMKYVETISYTTALMEIGVRDFPKQMGPNAPQNPPAPPVSVSYAGNASGAPTSSDFSKEAQFGFDWLMKMWDDSSKTLYYQVDNSRTGKTFPVSKPSMTFGRCRRRLTITSTATQTISISATVPDSSPRPLDRKSVRISQAEWQRHSRSITSFIEPRIQRLRSRRCKTPKTFSR